MRKLSRPNDVMMDSCARTCSTAESCTLFDQHIKFVACDLDSERLSDAEVDLLRAYFSLNFKSQVQH